MSYLKHKPGSVEEIVANHRSDKPIEGKYDAIILAVAHDVFKNLSSEQIKTFGKENHVIYDIKYLLDNEEVDGRL